MTGPAVGGLLTVLHACFDLKATLFDKLHFLLYFLASAMNPRYLLTVDANFETVPVSVRVGQAVETVGQAGRPKTITGFQVYLFEPRHTLNCISMFFLLLSVRHIRRQCFWVTKIALS